ncbi:MAG: hypothetical protein FJX23_08370 [Alphaproteobacteria bacterium]|nr:hypothetical protein [Alphaproteobacteria bacterium]
MQDTITIGLAWPQGLKLKARHIAAAAVGTLIGSVAYVVYAGHRRREDHAAALSLKNKSRKAYEAGQYGLAIAQGKLAFATFRAQLPAEHPLLLETKNQLILAHKARGNMDEALELVRGAFREVTAVNATNRAESALLAVTCSSVLAAHGQVEEAITGYEKALLLLGKDSPQYADILEELEALRATRK